VASKLPSNGTPVFRELNRGVAPMKFINDELFLIRKNDKNGLD
jgi:hypothetical protein